MIDGLEIEEGEKGGKRVFFRGVRLDYRGQEVGVGGCD